MSWLRRYRLQDSLRSSLSIIPMLFMVGAIALALLTEELDARTQWTIFDFSKDAAQSVLGAIAGSMITFTGFVFSTIMMALQFASGQISPRVLRTAFRDPRTKIALGTFVFTFTFALTASAAVTPDQVPQLTVTIAMLAVVASIIVFLAMIHMLSRDMRAANMLTGVAERTARVIDELYPDPVANEDHADLDDVMFERLPATVRFQGKPGVLVAYDRVGLVDLAYRTDTVIELVLDTGDFVSDHFPAFLVYGESGRIKDEDLLSRIAVSSERTLEQDPAFGFRILADAAAKALSPGINDPTTAVAALDQIHYLLGLVGVRHIFGAGVRDAQGRLRLIDSHATWDDYVSLALDEVRHFSAGSVQVARRLRALIVDLVEVVPPHRAPALHEQLELLSRGIDREFSEPIDRERARVPDRQGLGGSSRSRINPQQQQQHNRGQYVTAATRET